MTNPSSNLILKEKNFISFLLCCLAPCPGPGNLQRAQAITSEELDWQALVKFALRHRVLPLLYQRLSTTYSSVVPNDLLLELRQYCKNVSIRNLLLTAELAKLLRLMTLSDIDTMPYKGPVLAKTLYSDINLRQFGDLDIVIEPHNMQTVERLLIAEGYRPYLGS